MIEIVGLNKKQLKGFTRTDQFTKFDFAPISELREISQIQNPRAKDEDMLLFLAFDGEKLAGYLGVLPDDVSLKSGEKIHFGWLSTLYVSEKFRGQQIAQKLLLAAENAYDKNMMITEFTESAGRLYYKIGLFEDLVTKKALRYYYKSNLSELLPFKKAFFDKHRNWLKSFDNFINLFIPYLGNGKNKLYKISKNIEPPLERFLAKQKKNPIARSSEEFRWMIDLPWLSKEKEQPDYLFSSYSKNYEMFWVTTYQDQEIASAMLCSVRNGHLKVLYYFGDAEHATSILPKVIKKYKVKMMTIYDDRLNVKIMKNRMPKAIYKRPLERKYLIHKEFRDKVGKDFVFDFTDGDGDFSFT